MRYPIADIVVGCTVADKDWSLELWFKSLRANVSPERTGLVFTVPEVEETARTIINENKGDFAFVDVRRDHRKELLKEGKDWRQASAFARNRCLHHAQQAKAEHYVVWDPDVILPPRTIREFQEAQIDCGTVWTWLNRAKYSTAKHVMGFTVHDVVYQLPVQATAMALEEHGDATWPAHYRSEHFQRYCDIGGFWKTGAITKFAVMSKKVYTRVGFGTSAFGEFWDINLTCRKMQIPRYCLSEVQGVHFPEFRTDEIAMGWPHVLQLADQRPLQSLLDPPEDTELADIGMYPYSQLQRHQEEHDGSKD